LRRSGWGRDWDVMKSSRNWARAEWARFTWLMTLSSTGVSRSSSFRKDIPGTHSGCAASSARRRPRAGSTIPTLSPSPKSARQAGRVYFIATEDIEGKTLRQHLLEGPMKIAGAINIASQVASALAAAHAAGIIHRDIKPENVMLRPDGYVKVLDFGLAKQVEPEGDNSAANLSQPNTDPGIIMGTVNYMSPEQARGITVDTRSDIFSLGVALYEMLVGRAPFTGPSSSDVIVSILDREPPRLSQILSGAPAELE